MQMSSTPIDCKSRVAFTLLVSLAVLVGLAGPGLSEETDPACAARMAKWEQITQDLQEKFNAYATIQHTPAERIIQRPLVESGQGKSIAKQISEALQAKEDLLGTRRKDCRNLLDLENQAFEELRGCIENRKSSKNKDSSKIAKKRRSLVDKISLAISEVREVEGKDNGLVYTNDFQDPYGRNLNSYWQNYQQMYRRWWGR
jgi:hypothetical protein